ncbi:unnamed protein product [Microthlaspi erraticum]|uniref:DUF547 domain-containing protein n=1 Tax=Microthlaspi erraticum TaxID=1685480 RepID=A0A6D2ICR1_9BRAS|nr:unnamed protein product [Microthlaspi erraticum]
MPSRNDRFSSYSSSSFSSSSSSSQLNTPRAFQNAFSGAISKSPLWDVEKTKGSFGYSMPKSNEELKGEIAELETEILQLEGYLLSLYRTSFRDHFPAFLLPDDSSLTTKFDNEAVNDPNSKEKIKRSDSTHPSLADLLGLNTPTDPNKLSEEIVKLICVIHFNLSGKGQSKVVKNSKNEEYGEELGVVIHNLCLDEDNLKSVDSLLQNFRSLIEKLEKVDLARMAREEKLAFWINIHNALVMHAHILYGIGVHTTSTMILKAPFSIGGEWVNAYDVQSSILGIRACHSSSRLRTLFSPARSSKTSSSGHIYALEYAEPLLHFALSTGASTDPMVRVYTAEGIFQELRQARDGFIKTSVGFEMDKRVLLPKIVYNYAKDTSLDMAELLNTISECLTDTQRTKMRRVVKKRQDRCIYWMKHDSSFRYIIHWEIVRESVGI